MNAISPVIASPLVHKPFSSAAPPTPAAAPAPAAAITLSDTAQKALNSGKPQPSNVIWGSGPRY